jgi:hypothetical protein
LPSLLSVALLALACDETKEQAPAAAPEPIVIGDANNYRATSSLSIPTVQTASATDLDICWSDLESDILCHDLLPATDIDNVALLRISRLDEAEVEAKLAADTLRQSSVDGYVEYPTSDGDTCTKLSSFSFFETVVDLEKEYVASDERTYLLLFTTGTSLGLGARSMLFVEPSTASSETEVDAPPGCGLLEFSADIDVAEPVVVPAAGPWLFDWLNLNTNGLGNPVLLSALDRALVAFYADRTVADLEAEIFELERSATSLYELALDGGYTADLSLMHDVATGEPFPGFEREQSGVWLFGLLCSTCRNPAPVLLSVLSPSPGGT